MKSISAQIAKNELHLWDPDYSIAHQIEAKFCQENGDLFPALCRNPADLYVCLSNQPLPHEPPAKVSQPSPQATYLKSCINDPSCSESARIHALYDYVGAVYGSADQAQYDGKLSKKEKSNVTQEFGTIKLSKGKLEKKDLFAYLTKAREIFLAKRGLIRSGFNLCKSQSPKFVHKSYQNKQLGEGEFLGGPHDGCGIEFGMLYMVKGIELKVAADPQSWIFFLEGYGAIQQKVPELELLKRIAGVLKIPTYNTTPLNTFHIDVIQKAAKKYKKSVEDYLSLALTSVFFNGAIKRGLPMRFWSHALDQFTQKMGDFYKIKPKVLRKYFFKNIFGENFTRDQEMMAWQKLEANFKSSYEAKLLKQERELTAQLVAVCNQENISKIKEKLQRHPQRNRAFYQGGTLHQGLVEGVYASGK